jgi:glycosyltransferase involved in cell wall biosynthesis
MTARASVVIPAHDEEGVLLRTLSTLLPDGEDRLEVVVIANGCRDRTAATARAFGHGVHVVEIPEASKIAALNAGDRAAIAFPRLYLDADIELSSSTAVALAELLETGDALVASPELQLDLRGASHWVRAYYRIWELSAFRRTGHIGSGAYAVSRYGRERWGRFPEVIGDDRFVQGRFAPEERATLRGHAFVVRPPRTLASLVLRGGRIAAGNRQLRESGLAGRVPSDTDSARSLLRRVAPRPALWLPFAVYAGVQLRTRRLARRKLSGATGFSAAAVWDRDETSRT